MTLLEWVKEELDQMASSTQQVSDAYITSLLARHRITDKRRAYDWLNYDDLRTTVTWEADTNGGRVSLTLIDQRGTKQYYGYKYLYYLHPDALAVYVDGVLIAGANYTFNPHTMELQFTVARPEANPTVKLLGHLVDMRAVLLEAAVSLATRIGSLTDTDGSKYGETAKRIRRMAEQRWGPRIIRRRHGHPYYRP